MDGWNTSFLLGRHIFRCYVGCREGKSLTGIISGFPPFSIRLKDMARWHRLTGLTQRATVAKHVESKEQKH